MDDMETTCPLCMVDYDHIDLHFKPCSSCRYKICRFCWFRISMTPAKACPGCRGEFDLRRVMLSLRKVEPESPLSSMTAIKIMDENWEPTLKLLSSLAYFLPNVEIPIELLQNVPVLNPEELIEEFRKVKLVSLKGKDAFSICPEVQTTIRRCFGEEESLGDATKFLTTEFVKVTALRNIDLVTRIVPHAMELWRFISGNPEFVKMFVRFPSNIWAWFFQQDNIDACLELALELEKTYTVVFEHHHPENLNSKLRIGIALMKMCKYDDALPVLARVYNCSITARNLNLVLTSGSFLALTLTEMGDLDASLRIFENILPDSEFESDDRFKLGVYLRKGITLSRMGRHEDALPIFQTCCDAYFSMHTEWSRAYNSAKRWLAFTMANLGMFDRALNLYEQVYQAENVSLRPGHPSLTQTMAGMCRVLIEMGRAREAYKMCCDELEKRMENRELENQFALLAICSVMGTTLMAMKRCGMAKGLMGWIYWEYRQLCGEDHPNTLRALMDYVNINKNGPIST